MTNRLMVSGSPWQDSGRMLSPPSFAAPGRIAELACVEERSGQEQTHHNRMQQHGCEGYHNYLTKQVVIRRGGLFIFREGTL
jgi:hypothetical protein